ncbi:MAG: glycosyltransferase family 4 protein [Gammaproteobacteria bacterium]|nr:glycosyltransferase family 4 protein [Gammaproteobacteria bacterium]
MSVPPKILAISNYDKPGIHDIRPEAEMFIGLKSRGVNIEFMTKRDCYYGQRLIECGIPVYNHVPRRKFSSTSIRVIRRVLTEGHHDIIHLFNNNAIVNGIFASLRLPVKVVTYRGQTGNISRRDPTCYLTHLSPRVDRIVCVSDAVRQSLANEVSDPAKLVTIYKGHDLCWYRDAKRLDRASLGVPADAFLLACVANYRPRKGIEVLLEATHQLPADTPIHLLLVGRGMDERTVRELVATTVLPSIKREGLPKTVVESMALGITPIVTATGGGPELVTHEECGLVVPPGDATALATAMLRLQSDRGRNHRMGQAARQRLGSQFTLEASIEAHLRLYRELAGDVRPREQGPASQRSQR